MSQMEKTAVTNLGPVGLEVRKVRILPLRENSNLMRILVDDAEILAMLLQSTSLIPSLRHTRIILPLVEQTKVLLILIIKRHHRERLFEMWDPTAVYHSAGGRLRGSDGVPCLHLTLGVLRITG